MDICGDQAIFMPEEQCDSCEQFESDIQRLEREKSPVIEQGDNITLETLPDGKIRISATGGGGGGGGDCVEYTLNFANGTLTLQDDQGAAVQTLPLTGMVQDTDLVAGSNVTITKDQTTGKITISASGGGGGGTVDTAMSDSSTNAVQNKVIKQYVDAADGALDTRLTAAENTLAGLGEPFRVKQFVETGSWEIPACSTDPANTAIPKFTMTLTGQEAIDFAFAGMTAYEVFDATSGGNRLNFMPVCQFLGNNQTELSVRGCVMGSASKTARRISCWALLKHR